MRRNHEDGRQQASRTRAHVRSFVLTISIALTLAAGPAHQDDAPGDGHLRLMRTVAGLLQAAGRLLELSTTLATQLASLDWGRPQEDRRRQPSRR